MGVPCRSESGIFKICADIVCIGGLSVSCCTSKCAELGFEPYRVGRGVSRDYDLAWWRGDGQRGHARSEGSVNKDSWGVPEILDWGRPIFESV